MQCQFTFRHVDSSDALCEYTQEQMNQMGRFHLRENRCQVAFSMGRYECQVNLVVSGPGGPFKATAKAEDFYRAVDLAAEKLSKQFQKRKEQIRHHKFHERSREGRLERLNEALEYDSSPNFKKTA